MVNLRLIGIPTILTTIVACIPIDRIRNTYNMHQGHFFFESHMLLLKIFKVDVLKILW
jgi:hypothetical protein